VDSLNVSEEEIRVFLEETEEQLELLEAGLLKLEREGPDPEVMGALFRAAHTVKGSSAAVGHQNMAACTHALESVLDRLRRGELHPTPALVSVLFRTLDVLREMKADLAEGREWGGDIGPLLRELRQIAETPGLLAEAGIFFDEPLEEEVAERLREGEEQGFVPLKVTVRLAPEAIMPAVRAYQAYEALSSLGEVAGSRPSLEEIEQEKVESEIVFFLLTREAREGVRAAVASVPDVSGVEIEKLSLSPRVAESFPEEAAGSFTAGGRGSEERSRAESRTVRINVEVLDRLMNLVGELVIDRTHLARLSTLLGRFEEAEEEIRELGRLSAHLARVTGFLQDEILKARMVSIDRVLKKLPRLVRDLSRSLGKEVDFEIRGEDTELDRSVIEVIGDPLIHLIRNAIDHGIETPEERVRAGKPSRGRLVLSAYHRENQIVIEIADDGRGLDAEKIRRTALERGLLTRERLEEMTERELWQLLFLSGFSTAREVTELSGRGVGLDLVRKNIEGIGGRVEVDSHPGQGTTFFLYLPLTLATIRALLVESGGQVFAFPLSGIVETLRVTPGTVKRLNRREVMEVRGKVVPVFRLDEVLSLPSAGQRNGYGYAVLASAGGMETGFVVDALLGEQEIVIKNLGGYLGEVPGFLGATVLGDGSLALILDVRGLREPLLN
jgi:two-component system chemotaxis sensor kinase CheA